MDVYGRRQEIIRILRSRRVTYQYLMDEFGVSKQTIWRDVVYLSRLYPIRTVTGPAGGVEILPGTTQDRNNQLTSRQEDVLMRICGYACLIEEDKIILKQLLCEFGTYTRREEFQTL